MHRGLFLSAQGVKRYGGNAEGPIPTNHRKARPLEVPKALTEVSAEATHSAHEVHGLAGVLQDRLDVKFQISNRDRHTRMERRKP